MKSILILLILGSTCCASSQYNRETYQLHQDQMTVSEEFEGVVQEFIYEADQRSIIIPIHTLTSITSTTLPINVNGRCHVKRSKDNTIIKADIYISVTIPKGILKGVLFHELGHCILDLRHTDIDSQGLMNPYSFSPDYYINHWTTLVDDLFNLYRGQQK